MSGDRGAELGCHLQCTLLRVACTIKESYFQALLIQSASTGLNQVSCLFSDYNS